MTHTSTSNDDVHVASIHALYHQLKIYPQSSQYTVLAAFYLTQDTSPDCEIISLGTGTKCLPETRIAFQGEAVNDSHAEILARRGALRWLLEEIIREKDQGSQWIERLQDVQHHHYRFREGIQLHLYISTVPCGDASTRFLAAFQDPEMASLKDSSHGVGAVRIQSSESIRTAARGRDNYHLFNVLRTKPGRADSLPTLSLSCSDKIASWSWLGIHGALGAYFFPQGIYLSRIVIGEVLQSGDKDLIQTVGVDCERALGGRLDGLLPSGEGCYSLHKPVVVFTPVPFIHSRFALGSGVATTSSNESLCWYAITPPSPRIPPRPLCSSISSDGNTKIQPLSITRRGGDQENSSHNGNMQVLINGYKRGTSPKHRQRVKDDKFVPHLSKLSLFRLFGRVWKEIYQVEIPSTLSYYNVKNGSLSSSRGQHIQDMDTNHSNILPSHSISAYLKAKMELKGPSGPFSAWWSASAVVRDTPLETQDSDLPRERARTGSGLVSAENSEETRVVQAQIRRGYGHWERFNIHGELLLPEQST
ncbi:hypothetical protein FB446DRAFT_44928 [Lentinula raphanica]|nr:hypothetical protein FB446DRAFT_44928 [Lentinula raphanica]